MDFYEQLLNDYENVPAISLHADDSFDFKEPEESLKTKIPVKTLKKRPANEELSKPSKKTITLPMLPAATTTAKLPATTTTKKTTTKPKPPTTNITSISKKSNIKPKLPTTTMTPAASISRPTSTTTKKSTTKPKLTPTATTVKPPATKTSTIKKKIITLPKLPAAITTANPATTSTTSKPPPATPLDSHPILAATLNRPLWFPEFQEEMKKITTAMNNNSRENQLLTESINSHNLSMGLVANKLQVLCGNIATLNTTIKEQSTNQTDILTKIGEISDTLSKTVSELKPTETYNRGQSPDRGFRRQLLSGLSHQQRGRSPTRRTEHSQRSHARTPHGTSLLPRVRK